MGPWWGVTFQRGAGPRLKTHTSWKRPCGRGLGGPRSSIGRGLCLGPARKGRGSMFEEGLLACGVLEFGGKVLGEGVWVGVRPSALEGSLRGSPSLEVGPWVGVWGRGLGSAAGGRL